MEQRRGPEFRYPASKRLTGRRAALSVVVGCGAIAALTAFALRARAASAPFGISAILKALASAPNAKVTFWSLHNGKRYVNEVRYFDKGRWRVDSSDGRLWLELPKLLVTRQPGARLAIAFKDMSRFSLYGPAFTLEGLDNPILTGGGQGRNILPTPGSGGRTYDLFLYGTYGLSFRTVFTVDAKTKLPSEAILEAPRRGGGWLTLWGEDIVYDQPIPDSMFDPKLLKGFRVVPAEEQRVVVKKALGPVVAEHNSGSSTFAVRAAAINSLGDLFVAYTGTLPINLRVSGQDGTEYSQGTIDTFDESQLRLQGQDLRYSFWSPTSNSALTGPQTFTFASLLDKFRRRETGWKMSVPVSQVIPAVAPEYALESGSVPLKLSALQRSRWLVLERHDQFAYLNDLKKHPNQPSTVGERFLAQALACRNRLIETTEKDPSLDDMGRERTLSSMFETKGQILRELGRASEAEQAVALSKHYSLIDDRLD